MVPQLEKIAATFDAGEKNFPMHLSKQKAQAVRDAIQAIQASEERPELTRIR